MNQIFFKGTDLYCNGEVLRATPEEEDALSETWDYEDEEDEKEEP